MKKQKENNEESETITTTMNEHTPISFLEQNKESQHLGRRGVGGNVGGLRVGTLLRVGRKSLKINTRWQRRDCRSFDLKGKKLAFDVGLKIRQVLAPYIRKNNATVSKKSGGDVVACHKVAL
jgi:hypothetical protein